MDKVPFDVYDFFAFLSAGILLILGLDYSFNLAGFFTPLELSRRCFG
jgi:hypothetical protein